MQEMQEIYTYKIICILGLSREHGTVGPSLERAGHFVPLRRFWFRAGPGLVPLNSFIRGKDQVPSHPVPSSLRGPMITLENCVLVIVYSPWKFFTHLEMVLCVLHLHYLYRSESLTVRPYVNEDRVGTTYSSLTSTLVARYLLPPTKKTNPQSRAIIECY